MTAYPELTLFISGEHCKAKGRDSEVVLNPATGMALGELPHASYADLDNALFSAEKGFHAWRTTPAYERAAILRRGVDLIRERLTSIATILTLEQGKPLAEAQDEVRFAADSLEWYAEEGKRTYGRIVPPRVPGVRQMVVSEPIGPAIAFTPWNFPALTPARKIGGALASGCSLILKAAEETPGTAVALVRALHDAGLPKDVLNLVFGDPEKVSPYLIASPITRKLSFTGSTPVGRKLMHLAADGGMMRTTMELGGHAPVLVFEDVDVEAVAVTLARGKFRNAGQVCVSPTRFFVHEKIYQRFVAKFMDFAKSRVLGSGLEPNVTMGPLANERRIAAMERIVDDVRKRGGTLSAGGSRHGRNNGFFFEPTVVTEIDDHALVMSEEPFGPVAPILPFREMGEAIMRANALPFGLAAYAFSQSANVVAHVSEGLKAGMVGINTLAISTPETPFGGVKESGHGHESGIEGVDAYLDKKFVAVA